MIDSATGQIRLPSDGVKVCPALTREQFLASPLAIACRELVRNEPFCSFVLPNVQYDGHTFVWHLQFRGPLLESVSICCADSEFGSSSWSDWAEEKEMARKKLHEALLDATLGPNLNGRHFFWGTADSFYDSKSGGSSIVIKYST